ncbi:MAG: metal-sensing transcriptional repressor [Actinobacteria bacterium]|nr:metal-sensing transcriptional repressor [Cyanobacteriota bacterium]MCL5770807.1 metal-sensing transcriptional repressor [Actinomycetota bacterium]
MNKQTKNDNNKKNDSLINFKKSKSLLEKIIKMVEDNEYCIDIMQQNLAVIGMLKSAHQILMENHLRTCFTTAMESRQDKRKFEMIEEILKVTKLANK